MGSLDLKRYLLPTEVVRLLEPIVRVRFPVFPVEWCKSTMTCGWSGNGPEESLGKGLWGSDFAVSHAEGHWLQGKEVPARGQTLLNVLFLIVDQPILHVIHGLHVGMISFENDSTRFVEISAVFCWAVSQFLVYFWSDWSVVSSHVSFLEQGRSHIDYFIKGKCFFEKDNGTCARGELGWIDEYPLVVMGATAEGIEEFDPLGNGAGEVIGHQGAQPRGHSISPHLLQVCLNIVCQTGLQYSQPRTQQEEVVFGYQVTWPGGEAGRLKRHVLSGKIPSLENSEQEGESVVSAVGDEQFSLVQTNIGIAVLAFLHALLPRQQVLQIPNGGQVIELLEIKLPFTLSLSLQSSLIARMHEAYLFQVVPNIGPESIFGIVSHHSVHEVQLLVEEGLHLLWCIGLSFEIETCEVEESRVDLGVSGVSLEKTCCSVLLQWRNRGIGVYVEPVPTSLPVSGLEDRMPQLTRQYFGGDIEVGVY